MSKTRVIAAAALSLAFVGAAPAYAATGSCVSIDEAGVGTLFEKWSAGIGGKNPDLALAFYADEHVLKPHTGGEMTDRTEIRAFWSDYVRDLPKATLETASTEIDCNKVVKSGVKTIGPEGEAERVSFTMQMENRDGTWLITRHEMEPVTN